MGALLRFTLAAFYITLGGLIFLYPKDAQDYLTTHYTGLMNCDLKIIDNSSIFSSTFISDMPLFSFKILGPFLGFIGVLALFSMRKTFIFFSLIAIIFGAILHCPCIKIKDMEKSSQFSKMIMIFAILCGTLAYPKTKSAKEGSKKKAE